jgi:hypothetical protein
MWRLAPSRLSPNVDNVLEGDRALEVPGPISPGAAMTADFGPAMIVLGAEHPRLQISVILRRVSRN